MLHHKVRIILKKLCKLLLVNFACVNHLSILILKQNLIANVPNVCV